MAALQLMNEVCQENTIGPEIYLKNYLEYQPLLQVSQYLYLAYVNTHTTLHLNTKYHLYHCIEICSPEEMN